MSIKLDESVIKIINEVESKVIRVDKRNYVKYRNDIISVIEGNIPDPTDFKHIKDAIKLIDVGMKSDNINKIDLTLKRGNYPGYFYIRTSSGNAYDPDDLAFLLNDKLSIQ